MNELHPTRRRLLALAAGLTITALAAGRANSLTAATNHTTGSMPSASPDRRSRSGSVSGSVSISESVSISRSSRPQKSRPSSSFNQSIGAGRSRSHRSSSNPGSRTSTQSVSISRRPQNPKPSAGFDSPGSGSNNEETVIE
ncbi:hypothetical protein ACFC1R_20450 [Kitasatospora sp. NPDC056138]|uniref:hypothetical protein n=1 Tax=Kitasatospora sp. NPDC056138 TaxID=3345724 RepID=UPI0035E3A281